MHNLALRKPATQSSVSPWSKGRTPSSDAFGANDGNLAIDFGFHTAKESAPWWQVDLEDIFAISEVRLYNRKGLAARFRHFTVLLSLDGAAWQTYFRKTDNSVFGNDDAIPFVAAADPKLARFVRIRLDGTESFHLVECEVYGTKPDAAELTTLLRDQNKSRYRDIFVESLQLAKKSNLDAAEIEFLRVAFVAVLNGEDELRKLVKDAALINNNVKQVVQMIHGSDHVLGPHGILRSIDADSLERKAQLLATIQRLFALLKTEFGLDCFFVAGSLLGFVREGAFLKHDDDYDTTYLSSETAEINILMERFDIYTYIRSLEDFDIYDSSGGHFHVTSTTGQPFRFDMFTSWIDDGKICQFPISPRQPAIEAIIPTKQMSIYGTDVTVPNTPERLLEVNYGKNWRIPDPTFRFNWRTVSSAYYFLFESRFDKSLAEIIMNNFKRDNLFEKLPFADDVETQFLLSHNSLKTGLQDGDLAAIGASHIIIFEQSEIEWQAAYVARQIEQLGMCLRFTKRLGEGRAAAQLYASLQAMRAERHVADKAA